MAAIQLTELYAHVGRIWDRVVELYDLAQGDGTLAFTSSAVGATHSSRSVTLVLTGSVNTTTYILVDVNTPTAGIHTLGAVFAFPGFNAEPTMTQATFGAENYVTEFTTKLVPLRRDIVTAWTGATAYALATHTISLTAGLALVATVCVSTFSVRLVAYTDQIIFCSRSVVAGITTPGNVNVAEGLKALGLTSYGGGPSPEKMEEMLASLKDIALIDVEYSANNGASIFAMRGRVRTG